MRVKRMVSLLLVCVLCFGMVGEANASDITKTKKKASELNKKKETAEAEKKAISEKLDTLLSEMQKMEKKIDKKEEEITAKEDELILAKIDENDQYESMKKRIKYMYENGNSQFVEILCESKDLSDFLNKTEYISTISQYDREMLGKFQKIVKSVEKQEKELKKEREEMNTMQDELIAKQNSMEELLSKKNKEIKALKNEISANNKKMKKLEAAAKAAAEAARKQAEEKAAQNAASQGGGSAGAPVISGNGTLTHPCPGYSRISSYFGYRDAPLAGASTNHKGVDFAAPTGTPIYAAAGGTVTSAGYSGNAGNMIVINHGNGLQTYYMHCNRIYVSAGTKVSKGQNIAEVGSTGNSTGPHLHFQVMSGGIPVNPLSYL